MSIPTDDDVAFAFGEDQTITTTKVVPKSLVLMMSKITSHMTVDLLQDEETGLLTSRRENFEETRGEQVDFAPQNAVRDALTAT